MFLISGETGIGKTRLADELAADAASRGMRVVWGRCWEGGGAPAYLPWVDILRTLILNETRERRRHSALPAEIAQLIPELSSETTMPRVSADPAQARFRLFDAIATLLKQVASSAPLLIVLDDLHEADHGSLELLKFVARGLTDSRIVIVGTHRDAEVRRSPHLSEAISEILRYGRAISLAGLDQSEVMRIVEQRAQYLPSAGFGSELHRVTAGNPLFVDGIIRVLLAERNLGTSERLDLRGFKLPEDVRGAIRKRLGLLSPPAQSVLAMAAVLGQELDTALLRRIGDLSAGASGELMDEAYEVGVVTRSSHDSYRFTHPLIRESLYKGSTEAERTRLHRAIGEALEQMHATNLTPHVAALAYHYREAGVVEKAIDYSIRAGEAAQTLYAYNDAISQFEAALTLIQRHGTDRQQHAALLMQLGALLQQTDTRLGIEHLESAAAAYDELNLPDEAALVQLKLGQVLSGAGQQKDIDQALIHLRKAEMVLSRGPHKPELGSLYFGLASAAGEKGLIREAISAYSRAMEAAEQLGNKDGWCVTAGQFAVQLICSGRIGEALSLLTSVWEKLPTIEDPGCFFGAVWGAGGSLQFLWEMRSAHRWFQRGLASPMPSKYPRDVMRFQIAANNFSLGEIAAMRHDLADWRSFDESLLLIAEDYLARVEGDLVRVIRLLHAELEPKYTRAGSLAQQYGTQRVLAWILRESGDNVKAEEVLRAPLALCDGDEPLLHLEMLVRPELALNLAALGRLESAQAEIRRCAEILARGEDWHGLTGHYHRAAGYCATATGNEAESKHHFAVSIEIFRRKELVWFQADTFRLWGQAVTQAGQPRSALEKFDAAIEIYRRIGAGQAWTDRTLDEKARALGGLSIEETSSNESERVFRQEGEYWTLEYQGRRCRLRDSRGLQFIANLIGTPGREVRASDLANSMVDPPSRRDRHDHQAATVAGSLGDTGAILDGQAKLQYRLRLRELRAELEEAEGNNDLGRAESARRELEAIEGQLASALGLGGRDRRSHAHSERARWMVTNSIKRAIAKIDQINPPLGRHLHSCVRTGNFCSYTPDPEHPVTWKL